MLPTTDNNSIFVIKSRQEKTRDLPIDQDNKRKLINNYLDLFIDNIYLG